MRYFVATLASAADIIKLIVFGTVARIGMIAALALSDVGMMLALIAWLAARVW